MASLKDIAVPPNPGARRGKRPGSPAHSGSPIVEDAAPRRVARPAHPAPAHRYRIGERLRMGNGGYSVARAAAFCKVVALLPYEGYGALLYRVRSETETFERVVAEADLSRNFDVS